MTIENIYRQLRPYDEVYEIHRHDATELDITTMVWSARHKKRPEIQTCRTLGSAFSQQSVTELLCTLPLRKALDMFSHDIFEEIIKRKWLLNRKWCYLFFVWHFLFMSWLSVYAVGKTHMIRGQDLFPADFLLVTRVFLLLIAVL